MKTHRAVKTSTHSSVHYKTARVNNQPQVRAVPVDIHTYQWVDLTRYTGEKLREIRKTTTNFKGEPRR